MLRRDDARAPRSLRLILHRVRQRPFMLEHLAEITAIDPAIAGETADEVFGLARGALRRAALRDTCRAGCRSWAFLERPLVGSRSAHTLIVLPHVMSPSLDLLRLLLIHSGDFISGVTKRMQDFI